MNKDHIGVIVSLVFITAVIAIIFITSRPNMLNSLTANKVTTPSDEELKLSVANPYPSPEITGITNWINSEPLKLSELKGKVVLIDFWTYSCINCLRTLPYLKDWDAKYRKDGLVIIGVHSPEFSFEKEYDNVKGAVEKLGVEYPVAMDNDYSTWQAYDNHYWPAHYFIDKEGRVVHTHFGEGEYDKSEKIIQYLLGLSNVSLNENSTASPPINHSQSPETYLGYSRSENFLNSEDLDENSVRRYEAADTIPQNFWSLDGDWTVGPESITSEAEGTKLLYRFSAKEVYLVMGAESEKQVQVKVNGESQNLGEDVNDNGSVSVQEYKLYKLVKADQFMQSALLELTFDKGIEANAFTFGS